MRDYILQLPSFEGPLDLLLHFVRTRELDIRNLPVAPICHDYLEFLRACEEIDLSLSSEWLAMAARLVYIKSCTLLPGRSLAEAPGSESLWSDVEDPRALLVRELMDRERLLAIRRALPGLSSRENISLASYACIDEDGSEEPQSSFHLGEVSIYDLLDLYRKVRLRSERTRPMEIRVRHLRLSEVIRELLSKWLPRGAKKFFAALLPPRFELHQAVMTFLALLELAKAGRINLYQADPWDSLMVERLR